MITTDKLELTTNGGGAYAIVPESMNGLAIRHYNSYESPEAPCLYLGLNVVYMKCGRTDGSATLNYSSYNSTFHIEEQHIQLQTASVNPSCITTLQTSPGNFWICTSGQNVRSCLSLKYNEFTVKVNCSSIKVAPSKLILLGVEFTPAMMQKLATLAR